MTTTNEIRVAEVADAGVVAKLLRDFNTEFDTPVPEGLEERFAQIIAHDDAFVLLAGDIGFAYVTLRPSPYYDGPVAMLDELYGSARRCCSGSSRRSASTAPANYKSTSTR